MRIVVLLLAWLLSGVGIGASYSTPSAAQGSASEGGHMSEDELLEFLIAFMPETFEGWAATVVALSAILSYVLPTPSADAHPALRMGHKLISVLGLGATKLRAAGKIGSLFRKKARP